MDRGGANLSDFWWSSAFPARKRPTSTESVNNHRGLRRSAKGLRPLASRGQITPCLFKGVLAQGALHAAMTACRPVTREFV